MPTVLKPIKSTCKITTSFSFLFKTLSLFCSFYHTSLFLSPFDHQLNLSLLLFRTRISFHPLYVSIFTTFTRTVSVYSCYLYVISLFSLPLQCQSNFTTIQNTGLSYRNFGDTEALTVAASPVTLMTYLPEKTQVRQHRCAN